MTEENVSDIAQISFLVGASLYVGYSLTELILSLIGRYLQF